jgi:hypothetical protein
MKLRIGILLWILSWVPYGIILGLEGAWYTLAWAFEFGIGFLGIALAGSEFLTVVKAHGWRHAPRIIWRIFWHGEEAAVE